MCEKIHHRNHFHIKLQRQSYSTEQIVPKWSFMSSSEDSGASKMENNTIIPSTFLESFSLNFYFPAITLCIKNLPWTLHIHCYNNYANLARETFGFIADLIKRNFFRMLDINLFFCMRSRRDGLSLLLSSAWRNFSWFSSKRRSALAVSMICYNSATSRVCSTSL